MSQPFKPWSSLSSSKDFREVFKHGRILDNGHCRALVKQNRRQYGRLGMISSKKIIKLAVQRHQWRRIIRESFRLNASHLAGYDIVVIIKQPPQDKSELWAALAMLWKKIQL